MTEHRMTDLSYGQLGELTFNTEEETWTFSRDLHHRRIIQPLQSISTCLPRSLAVFTTPDDRAERAIERRVQKSWLEQNVPTAWQAAGMLMELAKQTSAAAAPKSFNILSLGKVSDVDHLSGLRATPIIALPHGVSGNVLHIVKPRIGSLSWEGHPSVHLQTLNLSAIEETFWATDGGPIQGIVFATDLNGPTSWLAVRKAESITILRPLYHRAAISASIASELPYQFPASRLGANPILTLKAEASGSKPYADVAFNPWYVRQFVVVDIGGYWSIWDIEGSRRKATSFRPVAGKFGQIHDHEDLYSEVSLDVEADGWGRALWVGDVSTIACCDRRHLSIIDLKGSSKRLESPKLFEATSMEWILDLKRNPVEMDQLIVLTTTRLFWLKVTPAIDKSTPAGATIILSQRHFRDTEDQNMKIDVTTDLDDCLVLLYTSQSLLVNSFRFGCSEYTRMPVCQWDTFTLELPDAKDSVKLQNMVVCPTALTARPKSDPSGPGFEYLEKDISFFQIFGLTSENALVESLCATHIARIRSGTSKCLQYDTIELPHIEKRSSNVRGSSKSIDNFLVSDDIAADEIKAARPKQFQFRFTPQSKKGPAPPFNAQSYFELAYSKAVPSSRESTPNVDTMTDYTERMSRTIEQRMSHGLQGGTTALELAGFSGFVEDIDDTSPVLSECLNAIGSLEDIESALSIAVSSISPLPKGLHGLVAPAEGLTLPAVYDELIRTWVTSLPSRTPGAVRLAKERLVRSIAVELYLSSIFISLKDRSTVIPSPTEPAGSQELGESSTYPLRERDSSTASTFTRQFLSSGPSQLPDHRLPTPAATESLPSIAGTSTVGSTTSSSTGLDIAVALLRNYTSVTAKGSLGPVGSNLLKHWNPNSDPYKYSWDETRKAIAQDVEVASDDEYGQRQKKEAARMNRKRERALKRQRQQSFGGSSQPVIGTGSQSLPMHHAGFSSPAVASGWDGGATQPDPRLAFSSQSIQDVSMTQPTLGAFGSRQGRGKPAEKRQRRKGF